VRARSEIPWQNEEVRSIALTVSIQRARAQSDKCPKHRSIFVLAYQITIGIENPDIAARALVWFIDALSI
jgi:hypothetical protein